MKRLVTRLFSAGIASLIVSTASASYNANISGVPTRIVTGENGVVLFTLDTQPTSHPSCTATFFIIDNTLSDARINRMYARLLAAQAAGEPINIGYDSSGGCLYNYIHAYQIG